MKRLIKRVLNSLGFELIKSRTHIEDILSMFKFNVVLDVGANIGQFAEDIRSNGFKGRIISFEPVMDAFKSLQSKASLDRNWIVVNAGLGLEEADKSINVTRSSVYSSFLKPLSLIEAFAGEAVKTSTRQPAILHTLDSQYALYTHDEELVFLKIDTQGFEKNVLLGGIKSLKHIKGVQVELSLQPLYDGEATLTEIVSLLDANGFKMAIIDPVTYDRRNGTLLQIDCIFLKDDFGPFKLFESHN